jgi:tetratricopeptide (TPR) repeat protein
MNLESIASLRHAQHYLRELRKLVDRYLKGSQTAYSALEGFDQKWSNIELAFNWSVLNAKVNTSASVVAKELPMVGARLLEVRQSPLAQLTWFQSALEIAEFIDDSQAKTILKGLIANTYLHLNQLPEATEYYEKQRESATTLVAEAKHHLGSSYTNLGVLYRRAGEMNQAKEAYLQGLELFQSLPSPRACAHTLMNLGNLATIQGDLEESESYLNRARIIFEEIDDVAGKGRVLNNLGILYHQLGKFDQALEMYKERLALAIQLGDDTVRANVLGNMAIIYQDLGDIEQALATGTMRLQLAQNQNDILGQANAYLKLGNIYAFKQDDLAAIELYEHAQSMFTSIQYALGIAETTASLAEAYERQSEYEKAAVYAQDAFIRFQVLGDPRQEKLQTLLTRLKARETPEVSSNSPLAG